MTDEKPCIVKIERISTNKVDNVTFIITDNLGHSTYLYDRPDTTTTKEISQYAVDKLGFIDRRKNVTRI